MVLFTFLFTIGNTLFGKIQSKKSKFSVKSKIKKLKFGAKNNLNMENSLVVFTFSVF